MIIQLLGAVSLSSAQASLCERERAGPRKKRAGDVVREKEKERIAFSRALFFFLILFMIGRSLCGREREVF